MNTTILDYIEKSVGGSTTREEWELFAEYASGVEDNGNILDIGTCEGRSALALAAGSKPGVTIYTIDPTPNPRFHEHIKHLGLEDKIKLLQEKSDDVVWDKPIGMFFNDGLHNYIGSSSDIKHFCPYVVKGGTCMFHDYTLYCDTVGKAIDEGEGVYYKKIAVVKNIYIGEKI
jgi:hypothetical protein